MDEKLKNLKEVLCKNQKTRNLDDVKLLTSFLTSVKFFDSLKENKLVFKECCLYLSYEYFPKHAFIFKQGEYGEKFYIIVRGEAKILVNEVKNNAVIQKEVLSLSDGAFFGELALTTNKPRAASVLTKTECHCAVMDKSNYNRILSLLMETKRNELIDFLKKQSYFQHLTKVSLLKLSYCFEENSWPKDFVLFKEGQKLDFIFLVKEGEAKLTRKIKIKVIDLGLATRKIFLTKYCWRDADIGILESGSLIGMNDIESGVHSSSCKVYSKVARVLKISIDDFKKRMNSEDTLNEINKGKVARDILEWNGVNSATKVLMDSKVLPYEKILINDYLKKSKRKLIQTRNNGKGLDFKQASLSLEPKTCIFSTFDSALEKKTTGLADTSINGLSFDSRKAEINLDASMKRRRTVSAGEEVTSSFFVKGKVTNFNVRCLIQKINPFGRKKKCSRSKDEGIVNIHTFSKKNLTIRPNTPKNWSFINIDNSTRRPFSIQTKARNNVN